MLHRSRKVVRLGYMTVCVMCAFVVYLVFWEVGIFHSDGDGQRRGSQDGMPYDMYGSDYRHRRKEDKPQQYRPDDQISSSVSQRDQSLGGDNSWLGVVEGGDDGEDQHFIHEYGVSVESAVKELSHPVQAYVDTELSENLMDIHEMDGMDVNSEDDLAVEVFGDEGNSKDFNYPEVGYRYQGVFKGVQNSPDFKLKTMQVDNEKGWVFIPKVMPETRSDKNMHMVAGSIKANVVNSNLSPMKKPRNKSSVFNNALPPPLVYSQMQGQLHTRYLVYLCDPLNMCGGWGDRQRGIVSTYLLSRLVDRQFRIIMSTPCDLTYFYMPNKVQWQPVMDELVTDSNISINAISNKKFQYNIMEGDFNKRFFQRVIYLKTNQDYYDRLRKNAFYSKILEQWGGLSSKLTRFRWAWNDLMQPSAMVLAHLEHIVGTQFLISKGLVPKPEGTETSIIFNSTHNIGNSALICAHVRMGKNPTIPMDEEFPSFKLEDLPALYNFMLSKDIGGDAKFFVATDNDDIRVQSRTFFGERIVDYGGKILHIDRQRADHSACVGFEVALMDQLILSLCDVLIVSRSGFSIHASYMSNSTRPVYIMEDGIIERFYQ